MLRHAISRTKAARGEVVMTRVRQHTAGRLGLVGLAGLCALVPWPAALVERWFSRGLYPPVQQGLTTVSNLLPVPWLDVLILAALVWVGRTLRRAWAGRDRPAAARAGHALLALAAAGAALYLVFLLLWGFNYRRVPLSEQVVMDATAPTTDAVVRLGLEAAEQLNTLYPQASVSLARGPAPEASLRAAAAAAQHDLGREGAAVPARLKRSLLGYLFRWQGVDAMTNPFGLEVLANPDLLPAEVPFVAAHEWAHLAGYAVEAEASYVGWLTCLRAGAPAQYSGWLNLYWQIVAELPATSRREVEARLGPGPRADLSAIAARLRRGELPRLRVLSWLVYDQYLKGQGVAAGVQSYGEVVQLVLRVRRDAEGRPVLRSGRAVGD